MRGPRQEAWLERLEGEHDNFRVALSWSVAQRAAEQGERAVLGIRLASALWRFWESYGYPSEGRQWLERVLSGSCVPSDMRAEVLNGAGYLALFQGDYELAITRLQESITLFKELEDDPGLANALSNLGITLLLVGDRERVTPLREDAEALRQGLADQQPSVDLLVFLGMVALDESDYEQMALLLEEGLALSRGLGDVRGMVPCLTVLGLGLLKNGDCERAALLQLAKTESPFVLGSSGEKVTWSNVARYMYAHVYDMRHFATMGIVPASVETIVRGWWLCRSFESDGEVAPSKAKLTSMLMLAHLIATSGNLLKTGVIFGMNPLALNWAQMLALPPVTLAWISETLKRNGSISRKLDEEWASTYRSMPWPLA